MSMKRVGLLLVVLTIALLSNAQSPYRLEVAALDNIRLPWGLKNLSVVDGRLHGCSGGVMVAAAMSGNEMYALQPDTLSHYLGTTYEYVVRNPRDGRLYFTHKDEKSGKYTLLMHVKNRGRKNVQVELRTWHKGIFHPTFSPDGNVMVFTSSGKVGLGGYDLWCSFWNGKRWSKPVNLGSAINGQGNEICPVFYRDYLIFASDSVQNGSRGYRFYSVKLKSGAKLDDILFGTYQPQPLPFPVNSDSSDIEMAIDTISHRGYWVSNRGGSPELFSFVGRLEGVGVTGLISDDKGRPIEGAEVRAMVDGRVVSSAVSDIQGNYYLYLQSGQQYQLSVTKANYFSAAKDIVATRHNEDFLVAYDRHDVRMEYLPFNRALIFDHLYRHGADVELSDEGKAALSPIVDFVRDNPNVLMRISLKCDQTTDLDFNNMIIKQRISDLRQFLSSSLPSDTQFSFKNVNSTDKNEALGSQVNKIFITLIDCSSD